MSIVPSNQFFSIQKLLPFSLMFISATSLCQVFGSVEVGLRSDSQDKALVMRQLGFLNYHDENSQTEAVFDYIIQLPDLSDTSVSQLYIKQALGDNNHIVAGRFHRFDNLGYYTLDGLQYQQNFGADKNKSWQNNITGVKLSGYAGRPLRTDDIHVLSGDYVFGLNSQFRWALPSSSSSEKTSVQSLTSNAMFEPRLDSLPNDISATIGYQALKLEQASQRLNLGVSAKSEQGLFTNALTGNYRQEFNFSTSLATKNNSWAKSEIEDLTFDARFYLKNKEQQTRDFIQLQYHYYNPELGRPTFKQ